MSEEIFRTILEDSATESERSSFYESLANDISQRENFIAYKNLYSVLKCKSTKVTNLQNENFERFWSSVNPMKEYGIFQFWYRYAAVLVSAVLLGVLMHYLISENKENKVFARQIEYTSEKGSVSAVHLEDGSAIWLSSASKITLTTDRDGEIIAKLDGEAFFDLVPDPARKLSVDFANLKVKDIGTKFNIRAYGYETDIYTSLIEGQVELFNQPSQATFVMKPGDYFRYDKLTHQMTKSQRDPAFATAWKDGKFVFIDKSLEEICHELENWYNVEIIIQNKSLANNRYTSVIKRTTTVKMVLKMLSLTDRINYRITDRREANDIVYIY